MASCYHCDDPIPAGTDYRLDLHGESRRFCCPGCRAVAELIAASGLTRFYDFRSAPAATAPAAAKRGNWDVCERPEVEKRLLRRIGEDECEFRFRVDGINCAACVWLIDQGLGALDGVSDVSVNPVTRDALVRFDPERTRMGEILSATERFGFSPHLVLAGDADRGTDQSRDALKRLAVAGLGFAQVMTLSAALYLGAFKSMQTSFTDFFVLASMLVATPVVLYAGAPIFRAALADLARGRLGMDVPVSLAITIALAASFINVFRGVGHIWFDSATMFVFFLTLGRFLEARARHRAGGLIGALADLKPLAAQRRTGQGLETVGTIELGIGDVVVVGPGEAVPADAVLESESAVVDEALLSGESLGRRRARGERLLGGSLNVGRAPIEVRVTGDVNDGYIEQVGSLLHRAMADRPEFLRLADRWAVAFVAIVLAAAAVAGAVWLERAPERALEVVLSMLVIACPCALSLAAPTAFAVALGRLARAGLLCRSARVLERLGRVSVWLFDKTGTLTTGRIGVVRVEPMASLDEASCLAIAAALEAGIEHPIARALAGSAPAEPADDVELVTGFGVTGRVAGQAYRLGSARHVGLDPADDREQCVYLAGDDGLLARIVLDDRPRPHAREAVAELGREARIELVSGDSAAAVTAAAGRLGIDRARSLQTPADKLARLGELQGEGRVVAAVGDGVNDAPLLAQADVSVAMMAGSRLAQASADIVFTRDDLRILARLPKLARATRRIVRQNLVWAFAYNVTALPLAATGNVEPWMAALGMSLSSLLVVGNALRLGRMLDPEPAAFAAGAGPRPVASEAGP